MTRRHRLGIARRRAGSFYAGLVVFGVALSPALDSLASQRFAAHMVQHLLLILVVGSLVTAGRPGKVLLGALPPGARRPLRHAALARPLRALISAAQHPVVVWVLGAGVLWAWHLPALYQLALTDDRVHAIEHASFLATAALFWAFILGAGRRRHPLGRPVALALTFATALQSGALGALLAFATEPLYPLHAAGAASAGVVPIEDQQLAGVLMWVPPGLVYLAVMVTLLVRWFAELDARSAQEGAGPRTVRGVVA